MKAALRLLLAPYRFTVDRLFRMGQVGWHWQFDDPLKRVGIPYEWTDTAGTTPVTAVGQGIGLLLGREYGGATGPSLLANGATGLTGTATAASYSTSTFSGSVSRAGDASNQSWVTWTGLTTSAVHRIRITNTGATSLDVRNGGVAGTIVASIAAGASSWVHPATTGGSTSITITATSNSTTATFTLGQFAVLPGTHLTQATGTAKPTLSARVNLLLASNDFTSASWVKTNILSTTADADGIGDLVIPSTANATHAVTQSPVTAGVPTVMHVRAKANGYNWLAIQLGSTGAAYVNISSGAAGSASSGYSISTPVVAGSGYFDFTVTRTDPTSTAASIFVANADGGASFAGNGTSGVYLARADCRTADDAAKAIPAYQRVGATATDHDTDGFPHFMEGDGTDNCMASVATVDGSATDKLTVVAAVTKNSDAAAGIVLETTTSFSGNAGTMIMSASGAVNSWGWGARGSTGAGLNPTGYAAPSTAVLLGVGDIDADYIALSVNGVSAASSNTDRGIGNFGNHTLYVLSRAGTSLHFNGRFYGSTGRFGPMSDSERNNLTRWWQKRIGTA